LKARSGSEAHGRRRKRGDGIAVRSQQIVSKNQVNGGRSDLLLIPGPQRRISNSSICKVDEGDYMNWVRPLISIELGKLGMNSTAETFANFQRPEVRRELRCQHASARRSRAVLQRPRAVKVQSNRSLLVEGVVRRMRNAGKQRTTENILQALHTS
jgi:hypothetical protein